MEQQTKEFSSRGIKIAAVTYDSPAVLQNFAARRRISYPLLSDEGSAVIRAFGILNEKIPKDNPVYGVPLPVTYLLDKRGRVKSRYFEEDYRERYTAGNILVREFGTPGTGGGSEIRAKHLTIRTSASNNAIHAGSRVALMLDITLPLKMHVYAPGVQGYIPINWSMKDSAGWKALEPEYPKSTVLELPAIGEKVPVFAGAIRLTLELKVGQSAALKKITDAGGSVAVEGTFRYQACDDKVCYVPEAVPLKWTFPVTPLDSERVPPALRKAFQ